MATIIPPYLPVWMPSYDPDANNIASGTTVRASDWFRIERSAQHYLAARAVPGNATGANNEIGTSSTEHIYMIAAKPPVHKYLYVWIVVDGYNVYTYGNIEIEAGITIGAISGTRKVWMQGTEPTLVDWLIETGTGTPATLPDVLEIDIDIEAKKEGLTVRSHGCIFQPMASLEV